MATADGEEPISEVEEGDHVLAYNEDVGKTGRYRVTDIISHRDQVVEYVTIDGETLTTTPEHPFYTRELGWVEADNLWVGAHVRKLDGSYGTVESVRVVQAPQRMYNLTVDEAHTFYVGDGRWLVHNTGPKICIHGGKQGKHIPGHNNFQPGKSELTHPDPQGLLDRFAGTGTRHGHKEVVDFKENIGYWVAEDGTRRVTTRGTIHYDSKGFAHIVPLKPSP